MVAQKLNLIVISSVSGAGRSTAEQAFEDTGFRVISNIPTSLWSAAVQQTLESKDDVLEGANSSSHPAKSAYLSGLVFGIQSNPNLPDSTHILDALLELRRNPKLDVLHIHLECDQDILVRRFSSTRRRHPFAVDQPLEDGIKAENLVSTELRKQADLVVDTTLLRPKDLGFFLQSRVPHKGKTRIVVGVYSFAFGQGLPREADFIFDARFLRNPHYQPMLREQTGREKVVSDYVKKDPDYAEFFSSIKQMVLLSLPRFELEGRSYLTVAVGCTGGRHRSVTIAEDLANQLDKLGYEVTLRHRDS